MHKLIRLSGIIIMLLLVTAGYSRIFPEFLYTNHEKYRNYDIYSTEFIDSSIFAIIDSVYLLVDNDLISRKSDDFDVFICNSGLLMWFHTLMIKAPTGASDFLTNNIYIAFADLQENKATSSANLKGRSVHSVIAHEQIHIALRNRLGLLNYRRLYKKAAWKVEGFCEWVAFNDLKMDNSYMHSILMTGSYKNDPVQSYWMYRYVVDYLIREKHYKLDDILSSGHSFESVVSELKTSRSHSGKN